MNPRSCSAATLVPGVRHRKCQQRQTRGQGEKTRCNETTSLRFIGG
ncbi:MAG: hypothetical protein HOK60_04855 [Planctomycetes bacterium]|nr:hypothetical protein [Planctomycetota bacterium]MBT6541946.1 hypothetical protein [Planctomycetota bacterium]MBT6784655.1 hypothetical protein [Planctomycetota bacterium]MBT6968959.1 hypothetical protein [Planctomycetota bacterium]MBT7639296.1 hypothetical protein [Planctomycetota bacterium]